MNFYDILNIQRGASEQDIKKAYRKMSLKHHPDRGGSAEEFQKVNRAYEILSDPMKKRDYDMKMNSPFYNKNSNIFSDENEVGMGGDDIPDLFKMFFGGGGPINFADIAGFAGPGGMPGHPNVHIFHNGKPVFTKHTKPAAITKTISISLKSAYTGTNYPLEIERWFITNNVKKMERETVYLDIPPGVDNNEIIILENKGNVNHTGLKGDVKVYINIEPERNMMRDGLDLYVKKTISLKDSLTGFKFDVDHLNGKTYTVNNTTKIIRHGFKSVIPKMGMRRGDKIGNLVIDFEVEFPKNLSDEQKKKLKEIL